MADMKDCETSTTKKNERKVNKLLETAKNCLKDENNMCWFVAAAGVLALFSAALIYMCL